jgi:hypothetical protein
MLVLDVVAGSFQFTLLVYGHMLWSSLGYHARASLKPDMIPCSHDTTRKATWELDHFTSAGKAVLIEYQFINANLYQA